MFRRLSALFDRFAAVHLNATGPGFAITDDAGRKIGNVDMVCLAGNRIRIAGWAQAGKVTLRGGPTRASVRPSIERHDVAAMLGIDPVVGFDLQMRRPPVTETRPVTLMITHPAGAEAGTMAEPLVFVVPVPRPWRARLRLVPMFIGVMLRILPPAVLWRLTGDPRHRATIKRVLGLQMTVQAGALDSQLLTVPMAKPTAVLSGQASGQPITIILPVYNAFDLLPEVLDRVLTHTDLPWQLVLIEDQSSDARVRPFLRDWVARHDRDHPAAAGRITLIENPANLGFIGSVNAGLARAVTLGHHVVLLNSDAFVPAGWASRLLAPILADPSVATVTPMSNDAEIFSSPAICRQTVLEPGMADAIDAVARGFNPAAALVTVPTGVGFCMAMNIVWLRKLPTLDPVFGRGYGEEVDWCQKARALGGRHIGTARLFVEHRGGTSFGSDDKRRLVAQNNAIIAKRYPAYDGEVQDFIQNDPLITARLALAIAWAGAWADAGAEAGAEAEQDRSVPVYLAHTLGGGAEKYLDRRMADDFRATGRPSVVLRVGGMVRWQIEVIGPEGPAPSSGTLSGPVAGTTDDFRIVQQLLAPLKRREIVYSCGVGDRDPVELPAALLALADTAGDPAISPQKARIAVLFHDYFPVSPSYTLLDTKGVYHGPLTPQDAAGPHDRIHTSTRRDGSLVDLAAWQAAWGALIAAADDVTVFSDNSRVQVLSAYPAAADRLQVLPHPLLTAVPPVRRPSGPGRVIAVLGNIGFPKGAGVLCDLADLVKRLGTGAGTGSDGIGLVLIGNIDPAFVPPLHVKIHGDYTITEIPELVARYGITDWLIPSIWPETFSYTTHEALATGLPVMAFDIGAQGDAVRRATNGIVVPFDPAGNLARNVLNAVSALPASVPPVAGEPTPIAARISTQEPT